MVEEYCPLGKFEHFRVEGSGRNARIVKMSVPGCSGCGLYSEGEESICPSWIDKGVVHQVMGEYVNSLLEDGKVSTNDGEFRKLFQQREREYLESLVNGTEPTAEGFGKFLKERNQKKYKSCFF